MLTLLRRFSQSARTSITITHAAWNKIRSISESSNNRLFLFAATSGGCSGFSYEFKNIDHATVNEMVKKSKIPITSLEHNNIKVYIDPLSEMYLLGTNIDYIPEDYSKGIYESKFSFNPNKDLAGTCGCGISFYMKE